MDSFNITFVSNNVKCLEIVQSHLPEFNFIAKDIRSLEDLDGYDVYVSPSNSFGNLKGGIDMQYYMHFGGDLLQNRIYEEIKNKYNGELLVGEFCTIRLSNKKILLLCPTMTIPMDINNTRNVYYFTRAMIKGLSIMKKAGYVVDKVFCPIPGVGVGGLDYSIAARQMRAGINAMNGVGEIYDIFDGEVMQNAKMHCINITKKN